MRRIKGQNCTYYMDTDGVTEILKSDAVRTELVGLASKKAHEADGSLRAHDPEAGDEGYAFHMRDLTHTVIATVHTTGVTTELDQSTHHTLNAINHE